MTPRIDRRSFLAGLGTTAAAAVPAVAWLGRDPSGPEPTAPLAPGSGTRLTWTNIKDAGVPVGSDRDCGPPATRLITDLPEGRGRTLYVPADGIADFWTPWTFDGTTQGIQIVGDGPYNSWLRQRDATQPIIEVKGTSTFLTIRDILFSRADPINAGTAPAIRVDGTSGRLSHVLVANCVFEGCFGAFQSAASPRPVQSPEGHGVTDITFRNCVFLSCGGDNVKVSMPGYFNNVQFDQCLFQSSVFRTYVSLLGSGDFIGNVHFQRTIFESGGAPSNVAGMELGRLMNATFVNCQTADWQPNPGFKAGVPIIKTQGGDAQAAPRDLTFVGCFMFSQIGPAIQVSAAGGPAVSGGQWQVIGGKWAVPAPYQVFDFGAGVSADMMTIMGSDVGAQTSWGTSAVNVYNSVVNSTLVRQQQIN